jgi:hypothetical protein
MLDPDPDPHKTDADPKHCVQAYILRSEEIIVDIL